MISNFHAHKSIVQVEPLGIETVPLENSLGRVLAENITADRDLPPSNRSAMDGYAVRAQDCVTIPVRLRIIGEIPAGSPPDISIEPGTCVRIMTGAAVPRTADTVIMWEYTKEEDGELVVRSPIAPGSHIIRQGEDARMGDLLLESGTQIGSLQVGLCAAVGKKELQVHRLPRVVILCTGEELKKAEDRTEAHEIRNSNGPTLAAALAVWGFPGVKHSIVRDRISSLVSRLKACLRNKDVVILTGGVSKGKYDLVREAVEKVGAEIQFHGVTMKPGKPVLFAKRFDGKFIFGLTGNPLGAVTGFYEFTLPLLRRLSGTPPEECQPALFLPLASPIQTKGGRTQFIMSKLSWGKEGPSIVALVCHSAADIVCGGRSDGVIVVPPPVTSIKAGELVEFRPWKPLP